VREEKNIINRTSVVGGNSPRVSVVMGIAREDAYLPAAIQSILTQTLTDFEFLIVVDANATTLQDAIATLTNGDARVRVLTSPSLGGLALALNLGIGAARGEYIARMDGDDISLPTRFAEQVAYLDDHPKVTVLGCRIELIGPDSVKLSQEYKYYGTDRAIRAILPMRNPLPHPGLMMRKAALYKVGGYKYGHSAEDHELFLRMSRDPEVKFHNLDATLLKYRRHPRQGTNASFFRRRFAEVSGYLFTEFLLRYSPKYLLGIVAMHPWGRWLRTRRRP
jgi:glycosyltransferase involved in cell wall biosynthesis